MVTARKTNKRAKAGAPKVGAKSNGAGKPMSSAQEVAMAKARLQVEKDKRTTVCGHAIQELLDEHNCTMVPVLEMMGGQITKHGVTIMAKD